MTSYLADLLGVTERYLADQRNVGKAVNSVVFDRFDDLVYEELVQDVPAFADMVKDFSSNYAHADPLTRDVLQFFWQSDPLLQKRGEMAPDYLRNHAVSTDLAEAPETASTRQFTRHDKYGAAMATIAISNRVKDLLESYQEDTLEQQCAAAAAAAAAAGGALDDLMAALAAAASAFGEDGEGGGEGEEQEQPYAGEGPMTEEQTNAAAALEQALEFAQQMQAAAQESQEEAEGTAQKVGLQMRAGIRQALREVEAELSDQSELMETWGVDPGQLQRLDHKGVAALAARLQKLKQFRDMVGRFRLMIAAERVRRTQYGRDEVVGVELSNDIERVLPAEFALSRAHRILRLDFLRKFSEGSLLSRKFQGVEKVGKGAIICGVDGSGSMKGPKMIWSKAFALGLLDKAREGNRDFVGINFGSRTELLVYRFPKGERNINTVLDFVEQFFNGGTDFMVPLGEAGKILEAEFNQDGRPNGDIVFITDGEARVLPEWLEKWNEAKKRLGFRVFGITVGAQVSPTLRAVSTSVRSVYDFRDADQVADIVRIL